MWNELNNEAAFEQTIEAAQEASEQSFGEDPVAATMRMKAQQVKHNAKTTFARVFQETVETAQNSPTDEAHVSFEKNGQLRPTSSAVIGAMSYAERTSNAKSDNSSRSVMRPTLQDFVADVTLAARRALSSEQFHYFKMVYLVEKIVLDKRENLGKGATATTFDEFVEQRYAPNERAAVRAYDAEIRQLVGAKLLERGIHPVDKYFKPVDVQTFGHRLFNPEDQSNRTEQRKSYVKRSRTKLPEGFGEGVNVELTGYIGSDEWKQTKAHIKEFGQLRADAYTGTRAEEGARV